MDAERKALRRRLAQRQQQKAELERQVKAAQQQYQEEIAPLKEEVLRARVERLRQAAQRHMRSARHRNAYHDAQRAYETFRENRPSRSETSPDEVKALYRRASKHCHPDVVDSPYNDQAAATFQALEGAYEAGTTEAVVAIEEALDQWGFPGADPADSNPPRTLDLEHLREAVAALDRSIQALQGTDAYQDLREAGDLGALLRARKEAFLEQLRRVRRR